MVYILFGNTTLDESYKSYIEVLLHEIKAFMVISKELDYNDNLFFNDVYSFYLNLFSTNCKQNKRLLETKGLNPLIEFNYKFRKLLQCLKKATKLPIILIPSAFIPLSEFNYQNITSILIYKDIEIDNNVITCYSL